jgi:hypothetical protein
MILEQALGLYTPRQAAKIRKAIVDACDHARRQGRILDPDVVEFEQDVKRLAAIYESERACSASGTSGIPLEPAPAKMARMGSAAVAEYIDRTERAVTALAKRGTLRGEQTRPGGAWTFDPEDVEDYLERRDGDGTDGK